MPIKFQMQPSETSNDHQTRIIIGDDDYLDLCDPSLLGIDPIEFFAQRELRESGSLLVGRCGCGCVGCGDEILQTTVTETEVTWVGRRQAPAGMTFSRSEYFAELDRAIVDTSWESVERTAERLVSALDFSRLRASGVRFHWASARVHPENMSLSLHLDEGHGCQLVCSVPWDHHDVHSAVSAISQLIDTPIATWQDVVYHGTLRPTSAGPAWRPYAYAQT
jgi:hypothetical protein